MLVISPSLLLGNVPEIALASVTAIVGVTCLAGGRPEHISWGRRWIRPALARRAKGTA